ncbi:V-type proton ATPase subunit G-like protein [Drosera capensis]
MMRNAGMIRTGISKLDLASSSSPRSPSSVRFPTTRCAAATAKYVNDHYAVLGLSPFASKLDVKRAYKRLALKHHPDVVRSGTVVEKVETFQEIKLAYEVDLIVSTVSCFGATLFTMKVWIDVVGMVEIITEKSMDISDVINSLMQKFEEEEEQRTMKAYEEEWEEWMGFEGGIPVTANLFSLLGSSVKYVRLRSKHTERTNVEYCLRRVILLLFHSHVFASSAAMDSIKGQESIQLLLTAEQEAQKIIADAKNMKMQRLRQAKEEAEEEIARYRSHLEEEHQRKISESSGSSGSNVRRLEEETNMKIQNLQDSASRVSPEIVALLNKYVTTVTN